MRHLKVGLEAEFTFQLLTLICEMHCPPPDENKSGRTQSTLNVDTYVRAPVQPFGKHGWKPPKPLRITKKVGQANLSTRRPKKI